MHQGTHRRLALLAGLLICGTADGQSVVAEREQFAPHVVVPQSRSVWTRRTRAPAGRIEITAVQAGVVIVEQAATTTMDIDLRNSGRQRAEAELLVPVPEGAAVRGFSFQGAAAEPTARLLPRDEARRTYEAIVARVRDPALLEFAGYNLIRSSVFPVEAGGTQRIRLTYEHLLVADGQRVDYVLPRSESLEYAVPWSISVKIRSKRPVSTVYSPSHPLETLRTDAGSLSVSVAKAAGREPGSFRLSYLLEGDGLTASLFAYPDPRVGGGYFLLLAGLPTKPPGGAHAIQREVTLVLDRSGSMRGEKIVQVKEAALQIVGGLRNGESFNVISYNDAIESFSPSPVTKGDGSVDKLKQYLDGVQAQGGTNIHDALLEALRQKPAESKLPLVLFLTDGRPTIGQTSERVIRDLVARQNPHERRVFTFGVGVDVNTPLLERIASMSRATANFVLPKEDVELKVAKVFRSLSGPVLASPKLRMLDAAGKETTTRVTDLAPSQIPDLFAGDQLTLLGQYKGQDDLHFVLEGNFAGTERTFQFRFPLASASVRHSFVPRLWASRKIGFLEDAVRDLGDAGGGTDPGAEDPRLRELVDEIVRLSTEFGILSEYTAFLAREGTDLGDRGRVLTEANRNFYRRSVRSRSGSGSVNQDLNRIKQKGLSVLNYGNTYLDEKLQSVAHTRVRQIADKAFYRRGGRWVDSGIVDKEKDVRPDREIAFGSEEFMEFLRKLIAQGHQGYVALEGDILLSVGGETILVRGPEATATQEQTTATTGEEVNR